jgi:hypothetical protein
MHTFKVRSAAAALTVGLVAAVATPALASGGGGREVRKSGACTHAAVWKLKAKPDNGRIEVEGEVDSNRVGQKWRWRVFHDGRVSAHGVSRTKAPSGSFSVERLLVNTPGRDRIGWRAVNRRSGERCHGTVRL